MLKKYTFLKALFVLFIAISGQNVQAQCAISGINSAYCEDEPAVTMIGTPSGGTFSGPGVTGDSFDPMSAGAGGHMITYTYTGENKYYIKSNIGNPWGVTVNDAAMNTAFGAGNWILSSFETAAVNAVFSPMTSFVFIDGSDDQASELAAFLAANLTVIENWVAGGGALLLNSAPNEGGNIDFGFGGTTLSYTLPANSVTVQDLMHPAYVGPNSPTAAVMTGSSYSHANIQGTGYTDLLVDTNTPTTIVLCEKTWGAGQVMMGGMTTNNFHSPVAEAANWRANLLVYMNSMSANPTNCSTTFDVTVNGLPVIDTIIVTDEALGSDGSIALTVSGGSPAYSFDWDNDGTGDFDDTEDLSGLIAGTYTVVIMDQNGCSATDSVSVLSVIGIEELTDVALNVSPNPATDFVTIALNGSFTYELTDLNGAVIFDGSAKDQRELNVTNLSNGVYLLTIEMNEKAKTMRFVKQ